MTWPGWAGQSPRGPPGRDLTPRAVREPGHLGPCLTRMGTIPAATPGEGAMTDHVSADQADKFAPAGLTFDDVLLLPAHSEIMPSEADTTTRITRRLRLRIPLVSASMDTV